MPLREAAGASCCCSGTKLCPTLCDPVTCRCLPASEHHLTGRSFSSGPWVFLGKRSMAIRRMTSILDKLSFTGKKTHQVALVVKNKQANAGDAGDAGSIPGWGRPPGGGHGNPLQYPCLENPTDRGAWRATVQGVAKSQTRLSD